MAAKNLQFAHYFYYLKRIMIYLGPNSVIEISSLMNFLVLPFVMTFSHF